MELTVVMRLRIVITMAAGIGILAFLAFPLIAPPTPLDAITFYTGNITPVSAALYIAIAYIAGMVAHLVSYPHGRHLAPLAIPAGLAACTFRSGTMTSLLQQHNTLTARKEVYALLQWEGFFWLAVVAAGFLGVKTLSKYINSSTVPNFPHPDSKASDNKYLSHGIAVVASVIFAVFVIGFLAQDVRIFDAQLGSITGQPSRGQVAFAVIIAFALSGFISKYYLNVHYLLPTLSAAFLILYCTRVYASPSIVQHMSNSYPAAFFARSISAILPIQMICFAAIGSIAGYWIAIKTAYSRFIAQNPISEDLAKAV